MKCVNKSRLYGSYGVQCTREALDGFTVCFSHIDKEALTMMVRSMKSNLEKVLGENESLRKEVQHLLREADSPSF